MTSEDTLASFTAMAKLLFLADKLKSELKPEVFARMTGDRYEQPVSWKPLVSADTGTIGTPRDPYRTPAAGAWPEEKQLPLIPEEPTPNSLDTADEKALEGWPAHVNAFLSEMEQVLLARGESYGERGENFENIARIWSVILGREVTPRQVALCNIGQKLAREVKQAKHDNMVDIGNYALIGDSL